MHVKSVASGQRCLSEQKLIKCCLHSTLTIEQFCHSVNQNDDVWLTVIASGIAHPRIAAVSAGISVDLPTLRDVFPSRRNCSVTYAEYHAIVDDTFSFLTCITITWGLRSLQNTGNKANLLLPFGTKS